MNWNERVSGLFRVHVYRVDVRVGVRVLSYALGGRATRSFVRYVGQLFFNNGSDHCGQLVRNWWRCVRGRSVALFQASDQVTTWTGLI